MLEACGLLMREIGPRVDELGSNPLVQAATQRWIEIIGEAASRVSDEVTAANPDIPWRSMIGMRNVLAHGYFDVDPAVVKVVLERDVPMIARRITEILDQS